MASGGLPSIRGLVGRPLCGRGAADEGRRLARGYSFRIKRISPRASQERFPGGFRISPRDPLETTKGEACGPLLWKPLGGGRGTLGRETKDERRGSGTPGRRALRGVRGVSSTTLGSGAQRSVCGGGGEGRVKIGVKSVPKGGWSPRVPGKRLAKRKARKEELVKCRGLPDILGVQHGAIGAEI